jgi:class 3 adenylate cyclase/tetratricopeptide (TPR) repeat protein
MLCPRCNEETFDAKRFCPNCGLSLVESCASCGAQLVPGKNFCGDCGTQVSAATSSTAGLESDLAGAPSAERRLCSVMFVDLVGFTPLSEKRDPEEVRELLTRYFDRSQAIVDNYGGTVEKFIGDAVMAVWGAPTANEDDAERAVRAALEIVSSVSDLGREASIEGLAARGGIVTGEVAITIGKVSEGMVLGDTVNSASRVQGAAKPGTVLVDEATWRATSGAIAFEDFGELTLKGKEETVKAWRALRVVGKRKGLGRSERLEPPFVGRDDELRLIKDLLHATGREHRARLVSITGVPGIGKSRLAWEFLKYVDGLADSVYWHEGRSASYGESVTFGALGEMIKMRAGITEAEDAVSAREKLVASVATFVTDEKERSWIEPKLAHLLGFADAPSSDREELFSAWRTFFERISASGLTVMIFEDLQWADPGLIDFVESILEWSRSYPIMVVTLSRPELRDLRPNWGAGQRSFTSIHLDPLEDSAMRSLLEGFVSGLSDEVTTSVLARAEGVPLYAVETVRMLVDRGVLYEEGGVYRIRGELASLDIPETLHALIASRLDALPTEQRAMLQDAAVLGSTFLPESLLALHGGERSDLDRELRDLVRKEFLSFDTDPRSPERGQYGFVQGVIGDVAASMLSRRDRSAKHLVAAQYYESFDDDELIAVVASHYSSAHRAAPAGAESEAIAESASQWLTRAGERAISLGSFEQALDLFEQALDITPAGSRRAVISEAAGDAAFIQGDQPRATTHFSTAIEVYRAGEDNEAVGLATAKLASSMVFDNRLQEAITLSTAAYEREGDDGNLNVRAKLALMIATGLAHSQDLGAALQWSEVALGLVEQLDDPEAFSQALRARSLVLFNFGRYREAVVLARGMVGLAEETGSLRELSSAMMALSVFALPDDPHETFVSSLKAADISRQAGMRSLEETNLLNAAETGIQLGLWHDTRPLLDDLSARVLQGHLVSWLACLRATLLALTGDESAARRLMAESEESFASEMVTTATTRLSAKSLVLYASGEFVESRDIAAQAVALDPLGINSPTVIAQQARACVALRDVEGLRQASESAGRVRGRWMVAVRHEIDAALAALEGRVDEAARLYETALDAWRALNCNWDLAITELELVSLLGPEHPVSVAGKEAGDLFEQMGAVPFTTRLAAASKV